MPGTSDKIAAKDASTAFLAERERIISLSYKNGGKPSSEGSAEIIDIVNDYPWIQDASNSKNTGEKIFFSSIKTDNTADETNNQGYYRKKSKVPVCYVVERKNALNGSITMVLGMLGMIENVAKAAKDAGELAGNIMSNLELPGGNLLNSLGDMAGKTISGFKRGMNKFLEKTFENLPALRSRSNLLDEILLPYRYLYYTVPTSKRYVFPMLNKDSSCFLTTKLSWKKAELKLPGDMLNKAVKSGMNFLEAGAEFGAFVTNANSIADSSGNSENDVGFFNEKPQSFKYPDGGELINLEFTLYNTTKRNAWKNNYRFLFLFALRNLPFKISQFTFVPPLLYDIFIPGVKRLPVAALNQMQVTPQGLTRTLELENFIGEKHKKIQVSVPEAWQIKLVFQSLISPSANLLLAPVIGKLNITVPDEFASIKKYSTVEKSTDTSTIENEDTKDLIELCKKIRERKDKIKDKQVDLVCAIGVSEDFAYIANKGWRGDATDKEEQEAIELILSTFGQSYNSPYTKEDIIKAADLLVKYGYAEKNPKYKDGDDPWNYVKRASGGGLDDYKSTPIILSEEQINNYLTYRKLDKDVITILGYDKGCNTLPGVSLSKGEYRAHTYDQYKKPDGSCLSQEDLNWIIASEDPQSTFDHYSKNYGSMDDYISEEDMEEALRRINEYNMAINRLTAEEDAKGIATGKTTPICDDIISDMLEKKETK